MTVLSSPGSINSEPTELIIRPAKGIDATAVAELRSRCSTGTPPSDAFTASMRTWLEAEGEPRITLLATTGGRAVGLISMLEHRGMPEPGVRRSRWGYIGHLFVTDDSRRQGIGTALIRETIAIADHRSYEKLLTSPNNMALSLFHQMGFLTMDELGPEGMLLLRPWQSRFRRPPVDTSHR